MDYRKLSSVNVTAETKVTDSKKRLSSLEIARKKRLIDSKLKEKRQSKVSDSEKEFKEISNGKDYITRKEWKDSGKKETFEEVDYNKDGKICYEDWKKYCKTCDSAKAKKYADFKVTDSYKQLAKRIKDDLEETETTEDAIDVVVDLLEEAPAEQVLAATVEVLGAAIDVLQENLGEDETFEEVTEEIEEPAEETVEEEVTEETE